MIRLILVDDQPAVRDGLRLRLGLEPDLEIVGEAEDGVTALALAQELQPDVALIDVEMPGMNGLTLAAALRRLLPRCAAIVLSLHDDTATRRRAQVAGAAAFVTKQASVDALLVTIREVGRRQASGSGGEP